jgi:hypothetical protein
MGWTLRNVSGQNQVAYGATHGDNSTLADATFPNNIAAGSLLVMFGWSEYINPKVLTFGEGTAGDAVKPISDNSPYGFCGAYKLVAAGGGNFCRVTIPDASGQYIRLWVSEWVYTGGVAGYDQGDTVTAQNFGLSAGAINAGAMTPAMDGELIVSAAWNGGTQDIPSIYDPGALGWATLQTTTDSDNDAFRAMYYVQPTAASITPAMTQNFSDIHHTATLAFKLIGGFRAWDYAPDVQQIFHNPR